jgi:protein-tyrosine phosphatase
VDRHLQFERLHNFRDVGGYAAADGRQVQWGRLYRSDSLAKFESGSSDWERFLKLGIRTVIDLRYPWEIATRGRVPEHSSFAYYNLSVEHRPYDQAGLSADVDIARFLADRYLEVACDGAAELRRALDIIADGESAPVVVHCASGKDRTGLVVALVLSLVGVSEQDIVADFALTGLATERLVADWLAIHPGRTPTWLDYGRAPGSIMQLFLADLAAAFGSVREYAAEQLGVDADLTARLRRQLLDV